MRFHPLSSSTAPPRLFNNPFCYTAHPLCIAAAKEVQQHLQSTPDYQKDIEQGKMFGVLVVRNENNETGFLAAFSGLLCNTNDLPYFVPAIFDILNPDCLFKKGEKQLNEINGLIREMENREPYCDLKRRIVMEKEKREQTLRDMKEEAARKKEQRHRLRANGQLNAEQEQQLIKESQFEKAQIKRVRDDFDNRIAGMQGDIDQYEQQLEALKSRRKVLSDELQRWIFDQFVILNAKGERMNLTDIFAKATGTLPPAGTGECAAPKLLQYAFLHKMTPLCMAEFWWGKSPVQELRRHLCFYPACSGKCKPILNFMLQGLDVEDSINSLNGENGESNLNGRITPASLPILWNDTWMIAVNKPSGVLSVKGKGEALSIEEMLFEREGKPVFIVHRLDMDTSGILLFAKSREMQQNLQRQFASHTVAKRYKAVVEGDIHDTEGDITLPIRPDIMDRPRQMVDFQHGKEAATHYKVIMKRTDEQGKVQTVLHLFPKTGRTHQLRVHCAHPKGLNAPIVGDRLYSNQGAPSQRLLLHAESLEIRHPATGELLHFKSPAPF